MLDPANRDKTARFILGGMSILGLLLLVLVLPPLSLLSRDGGGASISTSPASGRLPEGLVALSRVFNQQKPKEPPPYDVTVILLQPQTDARNLGLYTNRDGRWELLAPATLVDGGRAARAQLAAMPSNLAILRRTALAVQISGWLPPGAQLDQAAAEVLTTLNPVGFTPAADGSVSGSLPQVAAGDANVIPTVRAVDQRDVEAVSTVLASQPLREAHIAALVQLAQQPGNAGVDIDYRGLNPARKADFSAFVTALADRLHQAGRALTVSLPTPVKAGISWDTGAYDWEAVARSADLIKLAAEADPSLYHARMEEVLAYLRTRIDLKKVQLVVGRHSYEKGADGLRALSLQEGLSLASALEVRTSAAITPNTSVVVVGKNIYQDDGATGLAWDNAAFAVAFSYPGRGGQRTVWLENAFSLAFRLDLARRYGLAGIALDDVSVDPAGPLLWPTLRLYGQAGSVPLVQPNSALLKPSWQVQAGSSEVGAKGNIVWKAPPQPGAYDISIIVSDGIVRALQKIVLEVRPASSTSAAPATTGTPRPPATATPRP